MAEDKAAGEGEKKDTVADAAEKKKSPGIFSRLWSGIFRVRGDDFEKRLQHISKEEAAVLARLKRRALTWRRMARNLIVSSVIFEIIAVCYAIITTRTVDMNWKMRAFRVLPMFLLPALSTLAYTTFLSFTRMCDRKDQKTLERLRAERQAKIDELKEKTNYYTTQQLIQRYDSDPAAKAAAATVLASKLGAESGLKVHLGNESNLNVPLGKSNDVELVPAGGGLRNRKQGHSRSSSVGSASLHHFDEDARRPAVSEGPHASEHNQLVVDHYNPEGLAANNGGWLARIAALLVGEDPTQSYALICGNCHMHNGLVKKEDFAFITYYCPHCRALNRSNQSEEQVSGQGSPSDGGSIGAPRSSSETMKFALCFAVLALVATAFAAYPCGYSNTDGKPACNADEANKRWPNNFDPTRYWNCGAAGSEPTAVQCHNEYGFDSAKLECVPFADWQWNPYQNPPSQC